VGVLAMAGVANPAHHEGFDAQKEALERDLRSRFASYDRAALRALPVMQAYHAYYKQFKKTYHVQLQLESIVFKDKSIPRVAALVEAMFMAELKNQLLTAGHDLDVVQMPVGIDVAVGTERYVRLNGQEQELKEGDMLIADAQGVLSSVLYGPDRRTQLRPDTRRALFTVYAPPGIARQAVVVHLEDIRDYILLVSPQATTELLAAYGAGQDLAS
jgi:DNA/RNA-binding domain of Phe-tRNA-synthetase-like protein